MDNHDLKAYRSLTAGGMEPPVKTSDTMPRQRKNLKKRTLLILLVSTSVAVYFWLDEQRFHDDWTADGIR